MSSASPGGDPGPATGPGIDLLGARYPLVTRTDIVLRPDPRRVVSRLFLPGDDMQTNGETRMAGVVRRVLAMSAAEVTATLDAALGAFASRHRDLEPTLDAHFAAVAPRLVDHAVLPADRRLLIGAYFTKEFAVEAAALFNPSLVRHPDQDGLRPGETRVVLSVRAVGEGHLSSVEFRIGVVGPGPVVRIDDPGGVAVTGVARPAGDDPAEYELEFPADSRLAERVVMPTSSTESHGIEDARFTRLVRDDGSATYLATYTAFDGARVLCQLLRTDDFRVFRASRLTGPAARNKGMALFPRRVGGRYLAMSRWDRENNAVASSADGRRWDDATTLQCPVRPWQLLQVGNCGPPLETDAGWLVLTHGVGPMRVYGIGAILLDLDDPRRVVGQLSEPLLTPAEDERDGYVPNVVYTCGALACGDVLVLPYGCSDAFIRVALVDLPTLLDRLRR